MSVCWNVEISTLVDIRIWRTSLRTGAAERPNGSNKDDEGNKSSHSDADDHRHRQRLCREQSERGGRRLLHAANISQWGTHAQDASHAYNRFSKILSGHICSGIRPWKEKRKRRGRRKKLWLLVSLLLLSFLRIQYPSIYCHLCWWKSSLSAFI